jgi:hypothetical protein
MSVSPRHPLWIRALLATAAAFGSASAAEAMAAAAPA